MAYAGTEDLLLGDISLGGAVDPLVWIDRAAEEIDSRLGTRYELPLPITLTPHAQLLLKRINAMLATGRMLMAIDGGNDQDLHAYGQDLVQTALGELAMILNGAIDLGGGVLVDDGQAQGPSIRNQDAYSATAAFEALTFGGQPATWRPGV